MPSARNDSSKAAPAFTSTRRGWITTDGRVSTAAPPGRAISTRTSRNSGCCATAGTDPAKAATGNKAALRMTCSTRLTDHRHIGASSAKVEQLRFLPLLHRAVQLSKQLWDAPLRKLQQICQ